MMKSNLFLFLGGIFLFTISCSNDADTADDDTDTDTTAVSVDQTNFTSNLTITTIPCTLSDGTETDCFKIVTSSIAEDHEMGPWCPTNIDDDDTQGGLWFDDGQVYDVDGEFVKNLATFYDDTTWMMYDETTGAITVTDSQVDCEAAANPDVGDEYQNYCVECLPSYLDELEQTWIIPVTPVLQTTAVSFATGPGGPGQTVTVPSTRGIGLNGIEFSAPAPVSNILAAYTIAPMDDYGGHINVHQGYHFHLATDLRGTVVDQSDDHSALIGYAMDGHGIYALTDADGNEPTDLDSCRGHSDDTRGYHYHADETGNNNWIDCLKGAYYVE